MRIVAISDTHMLHEKLALPAGDVLVHSGDFSNSGTLDEARAFLDWLASQPHAHKVLIAGNHDFSAERLPDEFRELVPSNVTYLRDEEAEVAGKRFYGSPWTPTFFNWAFMLDRGEPLRAKWSALPGGLDVLVTHGPPYGHGDVCPPMPGFGVTPRAVGCAELLRAVIRTRPRIHLFGHIHEGYGVTSSDEVPETTFVNASSCDADYEPVNAPQVVDL